MKSERTIVYNSNCVRWNNPLCVEPTILTLCENFATFADLLLHSFVTRKVQEKVDPGALVHHILLQL